MDADNLNKQLQQFTFKANNGQILRMVNLLRPQECTVGNIRFLMQGEPDEAVKNSLNYLTEAGYVRIAGVRGETFSGQLDGAHGGSKIKLTSTGMELLMGIRENPAVDV